MFDEKQENIILEADWEDRDREPTDHELFLLSRYSVEEFDKFNKELEQKANEVHTLMSEFHSFLEENNDKLTDDDLRHFVDIGVICEDFADELFISRVIPYEDFVDAESACQALAQK